MSRILITLAALLLFGVSQAFAATCTWQGGSGNWSDAAHWDCGHEPVCVAVGGSFQGADDCVFPAGTFTITQDDPGNDCCNNYDATAATAATLPHINYVSGSYQLSAGVTLTGINIETNFTATSGTHSILMAGKTLEKADFYGTGVDGDAGVWNLLDDFTAVGTQILFSYGTLNTNGHALTATGKFSSANSNMDVTGITINAGTSVFTGIKWDVTNTRITFNAGTSTITCPDTGGCDFWGNGYTYATVQPNVSDNEGNQAVIRGSNTIGTFSVNTASSTNPSEVDFLGSTVQTISNFQASGSATASLLLKGTSGADWGLICPNGCAGDYLAVTTSGCCVGGGCPATTTGPCYAGSHGSVDATSGAAYDAGTGLGGWLAQDAPATPTPTDTSTPTKTPTPTATSRTPSPTPTFSVVPSWTPTQTPLPSFTPLPTLTFTPNEHASYFKLACPTPPCIGTPIPADDGYKTAFFTQNAGNCTQGVYCQAPHAQATPVQVQCIQGYTTVAGNGQCDFNTTCAEAYCAVETGGDASCVASCWIERWKGWTQVH